MEKVLRAVDAISTRVGKVSAFLILVLICTLVYEVIARYVFNAPTKWAGDMATFLWGGLAILAGAWTLKENRHVSIDIVTSKLSPRTEAIFSLVTYLLFFFPIMSIAVWKGTELAMWSWSVKQVSWSQWHAPIYPIKTLIPVAVFLLLIQGVAMWIRNLMVVIRGRKL